MGGIQVDASSSVAIQLVYIGSADNLSRRIGGRKTSYENRVQGKPDPENSTQLCPAEKCAVYDKKRLRVSYAVTVASKDWEGELLRQYVTTHGVKPGYRDIVGKWCRGNHQNVNFGPPTELGLKWTDFEEYGPGLMSGMTEESGVYRIRILP